ncbi:MAG TPA: DUF2393 family protein [Terriglobales bacterium]|nr:DUF2393 family protein [Terriglobales bacterium]
MAESPTPVPSFGGSTNAEESRPPIVPIAIGALAVAIVIALLVFLGRKGSNETSAPSTPDPYAANLVISSPSMSTAANFAGQEVTYIEGKIANNGDKTVTSAILQIVFHDSLGQVVQKETQRLMVITTRQPYIDTAPLSSAPLKAGQTREFRQTFEHVSAEWNTQLPEMTIVKTSTQ